MMDLPEDEAAWWDSSPVAAMVAVKLLRESDPDAIVPAKAAVSFVLAYERFTGAFELFTAANRPRGPVPQDSDAGQLDPYAVTVGTLRKWVELAARAIRLPDTCILDAIEGEIMTAFLHQELRENDNRRRDEILRTDALVLVSADSAAHERRVNLLNKEYDQLVNRLEVSQRARTGAALPPPVRVHRSTE